jgi:GNAT superfamily N-acetyltransferase
MSRDLLLQGLGYFASVLIAVSLTMRSIIRLRWINLIGAACFTAYGVLIEAFPVAALNFAIVLINVYFLEKTRRTKEAFSVLQMSPNSPYLQEFLRFYAPEIRRFQPGFAFDSATSQHILMVLRDLVPAGALILRPDAKGTATISLDFVTPAYRDFKVGRYLFHRRRDLFRSLGIDHLASDAGNDQHARYLERMGFAKAPGGYELDLRAV